MEWEGVRILERRLGFNGQLRKKDTTSRNDTVSLLLAEIDRLREKYRSMTVAEIRQSNEFISDVNATFDKLGHFVWPAGDRRSIEWLVEGRPDNEYYPRDLFCHKQDDQDKSVLRIPLKKALANTR